MSDLVDFLNARLDDDERIARAAAGESYGDAEWQVTDVGCEGIIVWPIGVSVAGDATEETEHIARHDPARVLREVAAKRAILDAYEEAEADSLLSERDSGYAAGMCRAVEAFAAVYAYHDDYRAEWAR